MLYILMKTKTEIINIIFLNSFKCLPEFKCLYQIEKSTILLIMSQMIIILTQIISAK